VYWTLGRCGRGREFFIEGPRAPEHRYTAEGLEELEDVAGG
jgi:hypothetical protein